MNTTFRGEKTYETVYWDIVGRCNAHCKYCFTGNRTHPMGGEIDVNSFSKAIDVLKMHHLVGDSTCIHLYVWGEPTLHSRLGDIIYIIQNSGLHYYLSSNCGYSFTFRKEWFDCLDGFIISMCGFSQESYDRIHKLRFDVVKKNIIDLVNQAKEQGYDTKRIIIAHHLYQFNINEIPQVYKFTHDNNISYHPYYAILGDLNLTYNYLHGQLSPKQWIEISSEVFGNTIIDRYKNNPRNGCKQFDCLVFDEKCNLLTCCCLPRNHPCYKIANIFDADFMDKLFMWGLDENCSFCIKNGLSKYDEKGYGNFDITTWLKNI